MAEEAVDHYRNGPSFLQRYLPFWMINYAKRVAAILVATIAIVIPLFTYAPKLYQWFVRAYLKKLYRRLRAIDARLQNDLSAAEGAALKNDLDQINRAASILPMGHSDIFFFLETSHRPNTSVACVAAGCVAELASKRRRQRLLVMWWTAPVT